MSKDGAAPIEFTFRWWGPEDPVSLAYLKQVPNTRTVVTSLADDPAGGVWSTEAIERRQAICEEAGLRWTVVESVPIAESIKLGDEGRDEAIEAYAETIRNLGRAGVGTICYNFMPVFDWMRTEFDYPLPDGSNAMSYSQVQFDQLDVSGGLPQLHAWPRGFTAEEFQAIVGRYAGVSAEEYRDRFSYFINAVAPVAEEAGVKLAIHPDDPPWPVFGLPRIVNDERSIAALLATCDSPAHGLTFCTGSLGSRAENDLPAMIRRFADRIHFVHARNVERRAPREFHEVSHDVQSGDIDLIDVVNALVDVGFAGPLRPDHGRMIWGETGVPGYGLYDRALGSMYLQGAFETAWRAKK